MRWILMLLALLVAAPAQAQQTGLPVWLVGTRCGALGGPAANGGVRKSDRGAAGQAGATARGDDLIEELWFTGRDEPQRTVYHLRK